MLVWAAHGARENDWLVAGRQTAGRGRLGRTWVSPEGNLHASTLVRLRDGDPPAPTLTLIAGLAAHHTVKNLVEREEAVRLKWPNDVMIDGAKVAGVLLERRGAHVIVGIGINIAASPRDLDRPVTSVREQIARVFEPEVFAPKEVVSRWLRRYFAIFLTRWRGAEAGGFARLRQGWQEFAHPIGTALSVRLPDGAMLNGLFDGLADDGALRLRLADGTVHVMHAGDVSLL